MRVSNLGPDKLFPWRVDVPRENMSSMDEVKQWTKDRKISCVLIPGLAFFSEERDAILFVLRWS